MIVPFRKETVYKCVKFIPLIKNKIYIFWPFSCKFDA